MSKYSDCETKIVVNGNETITKYKKNGKHVATKIELRGVDGRLRQRIWFDASGQRHLKYDPADVRNEQWYKYYWHGRLHSYDGKASMMERYGEITPPNRFTGVVYWHKYGKLHRKKPPRGYRIRRWQANSRGMVQK
jgi:hypothetical protein